MKYEEDPLEQLLDEQADGDFGNPEFKEHFDGNLANWSAKDFSDIYVRFHPHLLRHAKRYLTNHAQAEEVVQDAFLYLMTSLPEIDSEIGVLKLLKWKVRLLALDVIKLNGKASLVPVDEQFDLASDEAELDQNLIRADEAAIVSMALAKLNPRQREAIIASVYEEKETFEVASQLGLSENATRQLLFRAKSAFKKALVGEAETAGLSVSQILSIAARKAAQDAGKYISAASALLVVMAISLGVIPNLPQTSEAPIAAIAPETFEPVPGLTPEEPNEVPSESFGAIPARDALEESDNVATASDALDEGIQVSASPEDISTLVSSSSEAAFSPRVFSTALETEANTAFFYEASRPSLFSSFDGDSVQLFAGTGFSAFLDYRAEELRVANLVLQFNEDGREIFGIAGEMSQSSNYDGSRFIVTVSASDFYTMLGQERVIASEPLASSTLRIELFLDTSYSLTGASLVLQGAN